jgi:hypothetical protein
VLKNPDDLILLLSHHPADASFLAEIAVTQPATLELALNEADLVAKIATYKRDQRLAAVFVDVSTPDQLRKFEFELQSKLGNAPAFEVAKMVHYLSGEPLFSNREILQSPYFSFYSERKPYDFKISAQYYEKAFASSQEYCKGQAMAFDQNSIQQCMEWMKKEYRSKGGSIEWILKLSVATSTVLQAVFPARFDVFQSFENGVIRLAFRSALPIHHENTGVERILENGVSVILSRNEMVLFLPVFQQVTDAAQAFRFYKVEK